jgi:hypothetical protein
MSRFEEAMKKIRPLSKQELNIYKRIADEFGKPQLKGQSTSEASGTTTGYQ